MIMVVDFLQLSSEGYSETGQSLVICEPASDMKLPVRSVSDLIQGHLLEKVTLLSYLLHASKISKVHRKSHFQMIPFIHEGTGIIPKPCSIIQRPPDLAKRVTSSMFSTQCPPFYSFALCFIIQGQPQNILQQDSHQPQHSPIELKP